MKIYYSDKELQQVTDKEEIIKLWRKARLTTKNMTKYQIAVVKEYVKGDIKW